MLYFSVIQSIPLLVPPSTNQQVEQFPIFTFTLPSQLEVIILAVVVITMTAVTIYILIKIPTTIIKTSNKAVRSTAKTMAPTIIKAQHKKDTNKLRIKITARLVFAIKISLILIPVILTAASGLLENLSIDYPIATIIGYGLAGFSAVFFALQYGLARLLDVKISDLW